MHKPTEFTRNVIAIIQSIPKGKVATYGLIAKLADNPRGARGVVWILHSCSHLHALPWHRVIKSNGELAFPVTSKAYQKQKTLLAKEKVLLVNNRVDLEKKLWRGE